MSTFHPHLVDGVLMVWIDQPGSRVNTIDLELSDELDALLDRIERDDDVDAAVLISRKPGFIAGADIAIFQELEERDEILAVVRRGQQMFDRLERLGKPVVAAVDGACVGGGLELVLACHYRLASEAPNTKFAAPEVKLGLLPAFGGCQRLPRRVGLASALDMILTGKNVYAKPARKMGLVDATLHAAGLERAAHSAARRLADGDLTPSDRDRGPLQRLLEDTPLDRIAYDRARNEVRQRTRGNYPAPPRIIATIRTGLDHGVEAGLEAEREAFADLLVTPESRALVHLFFADRATKKNRWEAPQGDRPPVSTIGVLGAGLMGSGIAQVSVANDYRVVLRDVDRERVWEGRARVHQGVSERVGKGMRAFDRDRIVARLRPATDAEPFRAVDLTIEAVPEKLELKRAVLAETERYAPPHHVFASNTSSLPIAEIAAEAERPEAVLGMHYFSPVPKMPLLEVIATERTADWARSRAVEVGLAQGKNVIVVADRPGFYANRILAPYIDEALLLLAEGARIEDVDDAMKAFGFPVGPFQVLDEVGLDVGAEVAAVVAPLFTERGRDLAGRGTDDLVAAGITGRKGGRGFYRYEEGERAGPNPEIYPFFGGPEDTAERRRVPQQRVQQRLSLAMIAEAVLALDEGVIASPTDGDVGAVFGLGFPPFLGGPFHWLDRTGAAEAVDRLERLEREHGARFRPPERLQRMAEAGEGFGGVRGGDG